MRRSAFVRHPRGQRLKIATYNVNGVNGRLPNLIRWLDEASPDIVCLQELKAPQNKFPIKAIEAAGYGAVWLGQKSWNGVAILAKGSNLISPDGHCQATAKTTRAATSKQLSMEY